MNPRPGRRPKIAVIGGGTGLPILLEGLKEADFDVTAIVTVADDGGSSGSLRDAVATIPPGDIRNCLVALSDMKKIYKDVFQYRFSEDDKEFSGHAIGNLIIAAIAEMRGDTFAALRLLAYMMNVKGKVLPACEEALVLQGHFADGQVIEGETSLVAHPDQIQKVSVRLASQDPQFDAAGNLINQPKAGREVVSEIMHADMVIMGPGSLYTSILPNIAIEEIRTAIVDTPAKVVYICNIMTQLGETEHFSDADHVRVINEHLGSKAIDTVLLNKTPVPFEYLEGASEKDYLVQITQDRQGLAEQECQVVGCDFLNLEKSGVYHNQDKLVAAIMDVMNDRTE
ncbi:uridine diphosphate-N-acetylglucosamine-binding protein YvcK [Aerococcaceae bacterium 50-4]